MVEGNGNVDVHDQPPIEFENFENIHAQNGQHVVSISTFLIDGEINSANTVEEEPIAVDQRNGNVDVNDQHLIEFENFENIHPKNGQKVVPTSCILVSIGFDGPVQNSYSCQVITTSVLSSQTNITVLSANHSIQSENNHAANKRPIPALIPVRPKRRSSASQIILAVCNDYVLSSTVEREGTLVKINYDRPGFGVLRHDD